MNTPYTEICSEGSVTGWLRLMRNGNQQVVVDLWQRYFLRLAKYARIRFREGSRVVEDEEDVALSVIETLCRNVAKGRFPDLHDRTDLWALLVVITQQKVGMQHRRYFTKKRGSGRVYNMSDLHEDLRSGLHDVFKLEPSPETLTIMSDLYETLMEQIGDPLAKAIVEMKMDGMTSRQISQKLGIVPRTILRKMQMVRMVWSKELNLPLPGSE